MGLTIHYSLSVRKTWSRETIKAKLEALRQFCMDFRSRSFRPSRIPGQGLRTRRQQGRSVSLGEDPIFSPRRIPVATGIVLPSVTISHAGLQVWPALGCEEMNIGVCTFPQFTSQSGRNTRPRTFFEMHFNKPAWSLASPMPSTIRAPARVLKQFAKRWNLRRLRLSKDWIRCSRNHHPGCILPGGGLPRSLSESPSRLCSVMGACRD